jgi:peptide/nickel transport system substrate-binding protein
MHHRRRILTCGAALIAAALTLSACANGSGPAAKSGKAVSGGVVTFAEQPGSPPTYIFPLYDGANSGNNNITYLQPQMWLPLYWFGHSQNEQATINYPLSMADPPVFSDGGKTVTMTLKKYVWSDGTPVTSRDLEFWMNLLLAEKNEEAAYVPGGWMDHVAGMSAPSPNTFVLRFNVVYNPVYLLYNGLSILTPIPQHAWDKTSATGKVGSYDDTPAGARSVYNYLNKASMSLSTWDTNPIWQVVDGPWRLKPNTGFQVTGQTIMVPNKKYSGPDKPRVSEFEELPFTSATAEFDALQSGNVDYGYVPTTDIGDLGTLKSNGYTIKPWYEWGLTFVGINFANPKYAPLENQLYIRQAMQSLINQSAYIKSILLGYGTPTYGPVPTFPPSSFLNPAERTNPYPFSPSAAQSLLKAHGWTIPAGGTATCTKPGSGTGECGTGIASGTKLAMPLMYPSGFPAVDDEIQAMRSTFVSAGIDLSLTESPENTVLADAYECIGKTVSSCPATSTALSIISSPVYTYVPIYYPDGDSLFGCGGATNGGDYCNPQVESYIKQIITGSNSSSIAALYRYQILVAKQLPDLWFPNSAYQISAISPKLGGVTAQDSTAHIYPSTWYLKS